MKKIGLLLLVLPVPFCTHSQTISNAAPAPVPAATASPQVRTITLGNSVVALDGNWKFQPGDSPWVNGAPLWAQPGYDDSRWAAMDLTPQAGSIDLQEGITGFVPGWTQKGYPHLSGYAWYRLRVRVVDPGQPLWLKMPDSFDDGYEAYANGKLIGQFGDLRPDHHIFYINQPLSVALPQPGPDGDIELALRFYMTAATQFIDPDVGGMHGPPMLGLERSVRLMQASGKDAVLHSYFGEFLLVLIYLLVAPLALWAWLYNRRERAWLWLFLFLVVEITWGTVTLISLDSMLISGAIQNFCTIAAEALLSPLLAMFWWEWFGLQHRRWIPRTVWPLLAVSSLMDFCAQSPLLGFDFLPQSTLNWFHTGWSTVAYALLVAVILLEGFRSDRTEALLAALPISLYLFNLDSTYLLTTLHIPATFFPLGLGIQVRNVVYMLMILVIGALALRRFMRTQVREGVVRKAIELDLEQAQQLQQKVLIPETTVSPYFAVEAEYRPAQKVGGDFFQTLTRPDGTLLVVIGDVSGKGVSASMLVAVLVGAIRNQAEYSFDPATMLDMLNRRLVGRSGGHFATCLAAEIAADGSMRIANAGHLPPYLNGREIDLEGSLPLGIVTEWEYVAQSFTLQPGDRLTLITDGVVEATNQAKQIFGFERAREISQEGAAVIAAHAQSFGQEDDITVVGVEFSGVAATA